MKKKRQMITTNIRLEKPDWLQTKSIAAQMGMSLNEYVTHLITNANKNKSLINSRRSQDIIWSLPNIASQMKKTEPKGLSQDDQDIYED